MRRFALALIVLALHATPLAQVQPPAPRPSPADPIVRLIADLEIALSSGRFGDLAAHTGSSIPADDLARFGRSVGDGNVTAATIRERARRPTDDGFEILAEVFVAHGRSGRIATWQLSTRPRAGTPDRAELIGLVELASVDGLLNRNNNFVIQNSGIFGMIIQVTDTKARPISMVRLYPIRTTYEAIRKLAMAMGKSLNASSRLAALFDTPKLFCTCRITVPTLLSNMAKTM